MSRDSNKTTYQARNHPLYVAVFTVRKGEREEEEEEKETQERITLAGNLGQALKI